MNYRQRLDQELSDTMKGITEKYTFLVNSVNKVLTVVYYVAIPIVSAAIIKVIQGAM